MRKPPEPLLPGEQAFTVRLDPSLSAKMNRFKRETKLPATMILRLLLAQADEITVRFSPEQASALEALEEG
jgi:hypothetical protein